MGKVIESENLNNKKPSSKVGKKKEVVAKENKKLSKAIENMILTEKNIDKSVSDNHRIALKEIYKHIHYLDRELNLGKSINEDLISNFVKNIYSIGSNILNIKRESEATHSDIINLGNNKILKELDFGWLCVHSLNVDVTPGILRDNIIEPWNKKIIERVLKKDDTFINIGANFGYFTMLAASIVGAAGKVIAFEANPMIYECLSYGIFYSGYPGIIDAHNLAASDKKEVVELRFSPVFSGGGSIINNINYDNNITLNSINDCRIGQSQDTNKHFVNGDWENHSMLNYYIKSDSLDNIFAKYYSHIEKVKLLQIDVEGAEKLVLDGGFNSIKKFKPIIIVEFDPHTIQGQVKELDKTSVYSTFDKIKSLGYSFYKIITNDQFEFQKINIPEGLNNIPHCDIFALPEEENDFLEIMNII